MEPTAYQFPSSVHIWDLPGAGTGKFPAETYIRKMGIRYFDVVIIITADRFTEAELMLKQEMERWKVPHLCIRNKMDQAVQANLYWSMERMGCLWGCLYVANSKRVKTKTIQDIRRHFRDEHGIE